MKQAARIMFIIGIVFSAIYIVLGLIIIMAGWSDVLKGLKVTIEGATSNYDPDNFTPQGWGDEALAYFFIGFLIIGLGIFIIAFSIVSLIICPKKYNQIKNGSNSTSPRVFLIVFGAIGDNIFYILAGVFSLIARSQGQKQEINQQ